MLDFLETYWVLIVQSILALSLLTFFSAYLSTLWGAPWVPVSFRAARKMLKMAEIQPGQKLVDLGAGDGRIVILAALVYKAKAIGVEIDPIRCFIANMLILLLGLSRRAHVYHGDMFKFNFSDADVVTMYLLQGTNQKIKPALQHKLKPGTKVISRTFSLSGWVPVKLDDQTGIFMYEIGNTGVEAETKFV